MVIWVAPWCAIYLVDMAMRRARYDAPALLGQGGMYRYSGGWNWRGVGAFAIGIVAAMMFANAPLNQGPLIGWIGNGDVSIYAGFIVAGLAYYLLMRRKGREQLRNGPREPGDVAASYVGGSPRELQGAYGGRESSQ
jgi:NCS1 family nucleobase:cation symporter-1